MAKYHSGWRIYHSTVVIGDQVFLWGGQHKYLSEVHETISSSSLVDIFNIRTSKWQRRSTTGNPPPGMFRYACTNIGKKIYYYGGNCRPSDCFHNALVELSTDTLHWREVIPDNQDNVPMKRHGCGLVSFTNNGEECLLLLGGVGPTPVTIGNHSQYAAVPTELGFSYTNEAHTVCISQSPGQWKLPVITGNRPPPCAYFTIHTVPGNKGVMFGGIVYDDIGVRRTNDLHIFTIDNTIIHFEKVVAPSDLMLEWPRWRIGHSSTVINIVTSHGHESHHILVIGGGDNDLETISDCWILDLKHMIWSEVDLPESVTKRFDHSVSSFVISGNCTWVLVTGGLRDRTNKAMHSPEITMIFELVLTTDNVWSVGNIMDYTEITKRNQYQRRLFDRLMEGRKDYQERERKKTPDSRDVVSELMMKDQQIAQLTSQLKEAEESREVIAQHLQHIRQELEQTQQQNHEIHQLQFDNPHWVIEQKEVIMQEVIGSGAYGEVKIAIFRGTRVAAKCLHQVIISDYNLSLFTREMEISSKIHHPNIVQFLGATRVKNPILLYELMTTSLRKQLEKGPLTHSQILYISCDISLALAYIHQWKPHPIIHRDLTSPNVLMEPTSTGSWKAKLSDFGAANLQRYANTKIPGNLAYASPEANDPDNHTPAMDIYSLGVLMTEMVLCGPPSPTRESHKQQAQSIQWQPIRSLVERCILINHTQRPTALQVADKLKQV